jgi:hypothetical protein
MEQGGGPDREMREAGMARHRNVLGRKACLGENRRDDKPLDRRGDKGVAGGS